MRVRTEVAALPKTFDYAVPPEWGDDVRVGTRVRVPLHGRSVRGWVVDDDVGTPPGVDLLPAQVVARLGSAAAAGGAGRVGRVALGRPGLVLPPGGVAGARSCARCPDRRRRRRRCGHEGAAAALPAGWDLGLGEPGATVVRLPPVTDLIDLVLAVVDDPAVRARGGSTCSCSSRRPGGRSGSRPGCVRRGYPATGTWEQARAGWPVVVGSRAGAWAPVPRLAAAVVLDAHDAAYREESAPTYSAVDVRPRARPAGGEPLPPGVTGPAGRAGGARRAAPPAAAAPARSGRGGPTLERVDRRGADPRTRHVLRGVRAPGPGRAGRCRGGASAGPLVCVYNRTGGARLLACRHCGELARCTRCGAAAGAAAGRAGPARARAAVRPGRSCARLRTAAHEDAAGRREPPARGVGGAARRRGRARWPGPVAAERGAAAPRRPRSWSAPRRCCTGCAAPPPWPSSTSTSTCWPPRLSAHRGHPGALGPGRAAGRARGTRPAVGAPAGPDPGARSPGAAGRRREGEPDARAGRGGGDAPRLGPATVLRAGRCCRVRSPRPTPRRCARRAPDRRRGREAVVGVAARRRPASCCGPPRTARSATCWPGRRGRPDGVCASRSIRRTL